MHITDKDYYQKSKLFLLPLAEVPRNPIIKPVGTYIIDSNRGITEKEYKLILPFEKDDSSEFSFYEKSLIDSNFFDTVNYYETKKHRVYVYSLLSYKDDYDRFLQGKYTEFSNSVKTLINIYWGKLHKGKFIPHAQIDAYINPNIMTYEQVSDELDVPIKLLVRLKQLLDPPNLTKETFFSQELIASKTDQVE